MLSTGKERIYSFDNIKFILIFLVVLGHLLRISEVWKQWGEWVYCLIYSMHMPVFVFLSGLFAKYDRRKIVFHLGYRYVLFQMLYSLFGHCYLEEQSYLTMEYQFTTPFWSLWYLLISVLFYLFIPLFDVQDGRKQLRIVVLCFILSLLSGFETDIGYYLSLGRFFSFLPFFVMGYYAKSARDKILSSKSTGKTLLFIAGAISLVVYFRKFCHITPETFFGAYSYSELGNGITTKIIIQAIALFWIMFFMVVFVPRMNYKIPLITTIGKNTLPIYVFHGFIVRVIGKEVPRSEFLLYDVILVAVVTVVLLGNVVTAKLFHWFCTGWWLEKVWDKSKEK